MNWIFGAHSLSKDTLLSQVMGERRAWSCLNLIHQNLLTSHGVLSEKWMGSWVKLRWRVRGRMGESGNYGWYVKWKNKTFILKKFKKASDDEFGQYSFQPKWVYSVHLFRQFVFRGRHLWETLFRSKLPSILTLDNLSCLLFCDDPWAIDAVTMIQMYWLKMGPCDILISAMCPGWFSPMVSIYWNEKLL